MPTSVRFPLLSGILAVCVAFLTVDARAQAPYAPPPSNRVDLNFNHEWKFTKSDVANAQTAGFNDTSWSDVSLPHTWNDDKFREWCNQNNSTAADPLLPRGTYYGIGWYRKHFRLDAAYAGRKVILEFQGIGRCAHFYVNGVDLGYHENGIGPCGLDVTAALNPAGDDNVIAVWVTNDFNYVTHEYGTQVPYGQPFNVNYGGLVKDVTLHVSDPLHQTLPLYRNLGTQGIYVYPTGIDTLAKTAGLTVEAEVRNDYPAARTATLDAVIVDADGKQVGPTLTAPAQTVAAGQMLTFKAATSMADIHFWSPDYPYLYQVYTVLKVGGTVVDVAKTPLGVRKYKFGSTIGLEVNGHPLYLNGYAPRTTMEWPNVGMPPDWMVDYDFSLIKESNGNFLRPMHSAPRKVIVDAADKYGVVMTIPAASGENDEPDPVMWAQKLAIMRDVTIYYRNNPSVLFYEGCNGDLGVQHMTDMVNVRKQWDPNGGRLTGTRSTGDGSNAHGIREWAASMDGAQQDPTVPLWDAEYARGECSRRVWDTDSPILNPRWDGKNPDPTPAAGTVGDTTHKYVTGGYFYVASDFHQALGLNGTDGNCIDDYLAVIPTAKGATNGYFRLQSSEDMVLQNLAKYYARYAKSVFVQPQATSKDKGVNVGGAKIIWSDSVTDGRMVNMEVARVSGAVDGARLPKEVFYAMQVAQNPEPQVHVVGHWNYAPGFVKKVLYVVSNTSQVNLKTFDAGGKLLRDYGFGRTDFFPPEVLPPGSDQVNRYVFRFDNVAWQPGSITATGFNDGSTAALASHTKSNAGPAAAVRLTPITNPAGWLADGADVAMFDVEVVDAKGNRCPTFEDAVTFSCSDPSTGAFLGGYNGGTRYSTNYSHLTSGYKLNVEAGINRVFVRSTRAPGTFTLTAAANGLISDVQSITSAPFPVVNGLTAARPRPYTVPPLGAEPAPVKEGIAPPPPPNSPNPAPTTNVTGFEYSGGHQGQVDVIGNVQPGQLAYEDSATVTLPANLPRYLIGGEFIRPFQGDAGERSSTDQYQMYVSRFSYVYQVIDQANGMPDHDNNVIYGWSKLADTMTVNGRVMSIYRSRLLPPYSQVYLATNGHNNAAPGFDPASNMYLLFIVSAEQELQHPTDSIVASTEQNAGTKAVNAIDNNVATRWNASSGATGETLTLTLARPCAIGGYEINWTSGDTRVYTYRVDVSADGTTWTKSLDMTGNVRTGIDEYRVPAPLLGGSAAVNYVRITVIGAGGGGWASVNELKVHGVINSAAATDPVPTVSSPLTTTGRAGYAFSYFIQANGNPTGYTAQGLPKGWSVNATTGEISGITLQSGVIPVTVSAINAAGTGSAVLKITMADPPPVPVVTSPLTYSTQAGVAIPTASAYTVAASNMSITPSSFSATLPNGLGLGFSTTTGKITGTPKYPGTYAIPLRGINPGGPGPVATLQFTVTPNGAPPAITSGDAVAAITGTTFSYFIRGTGTPTLFGATNLPTGLRVNTGTGEIYGKVTTAGVHEQVVISAANAGGQATRNLTITATRNPDAPTITSALTASGRVGSAFSYAIQATGAATITFDTMAEPPGLTLTGNTLAGTPTAQGTTNVTLTATNAAGSDSQTLVLTVGPKVTAPVVSSSANAVGAVGAPFTYQVTATNVPTRFTASAPLPAGLGFDPLTGLLSGTPTAAGTTTVTLGAANDGGTSPSKTLTIAISPAGSDINLALNKTVTTQDPVINNNFGRYAVDGDVVSRWESPHNDLEWICVDLGAVYPVHAVNLNWQNSYGQNYRIEVSRNGTDWTDFVPPVVGNKKANVWLNYPGNAPAQYVRVNGTLRGTGYGYSLQEFQVMGPPSAVASPTGLTAGPGSSAGQVVLGWNAVTGAQGYTVQRSGPGAAGGFATIGSVNAPTVTLTDADPSLRGGQTYSYRVAATTAQGTSAFGPAVAGTPYVPPGMAGWRYRYFGLAGMSPTDANGASDRANPAGDGINNLTKYALGLDPTANYYATGANGMPVVQRQTTGADTRLTLTFTGAVPDVTYNVQATSALTGAWETLATFTGASAVNTFTVPDSQPTNASTARFMRLQITTP